MIRSFYVVWNQIVFIFMRYYAKKHLYKYMYKCFLSFSDPGGGRTHDPQIKSLLLYQLSYEVIMLLKRDFF